MTVPDGERIRVVVAQGDDDADHAATAVARAMRDAGMEVVHAGRVSPEALVATVVQEDADAVGLPVPGTEASALLARLAALLADHGAGDVVLFGCGEEAALPGPTRVLPPGSPPAAVADWLRSRLGR